MASENLLKIAMKLAKSLGANESKYMGRRSNINFLGKGPDEGKLFQQDINTEALAALPLNKVLPEIETSMSYASNGKLNDIQVNKLIDNMSKMADFYRPLTLDSVANVTDMATGTGGLTRGGLESLRGVGLKNLDNVSEPNTFVSKMKKQYTDSIRDKTENMPGRNNSNYELLQQSLRDSEDALTAINRVEKTGGSLEEQTKLFDSLRLQNINKPSSVRLTDEVVTESPLMSKISERVGNIKNETEQASAIMETVPRNELPGKTAAAREFLLNALKEGDDVGRTTFADTINPRDLKFITEGGGGVDGDPIVLVQKYFGPRVAELLPSNATVEDMAIFTKRIIEGSTDAKGLRPTDPDFDNLTLRISEKIDDIPFADGGRASYRVGGLAKAILKKINKKKVKDAVDDIFETGDYKYDAEIAAEALVENNPKLFGGKLIDDIDEGLRSEIYGLTLAELSTRMALKMQLRRAAVGKGVVNEKIPEFKRESMKLADGVTGKGKPFQTFETTTPPRQFSLNVEKAVSELNIPREEAMRIAQLPSSEQKAALDFYLNRSTSQQAELMNYNPKKFDAAKGGLAKILGV